MAVWFAYLIAGVLDHARLPLSSLVPIQFTSAFREHDEGVGASECEGAAGGQASIW